MPDYVSSREFGRGMDDVKSQLKDIADGQKDLLKAQQKFFRKQAVINSDFDNIKKKYNIISTALIVLIVGTVYTKATTQPAIQQHKEIPTLQIKPVTKDLIK